MSVLARAMTEDELLQAITEAATYRGWMWHHVRRSDKALQMGHAGFPDLVCARNGRILFLELKSQKGVYSGDQAAWMNALDAKLPFTGTDVVGMLVRPSDLDDVLEMLE